MTTTEDRLAAAENAMADAREERDEANTHAAGLQARLDRIVSFLAVKHDFQGHSAAWAETVVRIAQGERDRTVSDATPHPPSTPTPAQARPRRGGTLFPELGFCVGEHTTPTGGQSLADEFREWAAAQPPAAGELEEGGTAP